jgi:hypothetical protein
MAVLGAPTEISGNCLLLENEPNRPQFESDMTAFLLIGITAVVSTIWPLLTMFPAVKWEAGLAGKSSSPVSNCGLSFSSFQCAGYSITWLGFFIVSLTETVFWALTFIDG